MTNMAEKLVPFMRFLTGVLLEQDHPEWCYTADALLWACLTHSGSGDKMCEIWKMENRQEKCVRCMGVLASSS